MIIIHYIVPRIINRDFKDEEGIKIENKYGYLRTSIYYNISKFENMPDDLYEDFDNYFK